VVCFDRAWLSARVAKSYAERRDRTEKKERAVKLGNSEVDISTVVRDIRGVEDIVAEAIETDWSEKRYLRFDQRMYPFAEASDIAEWDSYLTSQYPPLYTAPEEICHDCHMGPCNLKKAEGKCGLEFEAYQAKLNLRSACRGCLSQVMDAREVLNYAIKVFGKGKSISWGMGQGRSDTCHIGLLTGLYPQSLADLDRAQSYAEEQLDKLLVASVQGTGSVADFEEMAFHAGSVLLVAQDVAELVKMNCFGLANAAEQDWREVTFFPWMVNGGLGSLEPGKPVVLFVGDNFLPGWVAANYLNEKGLTEQIEICGIGPAGDDIARFYDRCRVITGMVKASKAIRSGIADVIVGSSSCISFDILADAQSVDSRLIWISKERNVGLPDRTDDPVDKIVEDLIAGAPGAWIRDCEKAGEVAVKAAQGIKRKPASGYLLSEDEAKKEAKKCREDCDLCFNVCPNSLMIGRGLRKVAQEGLGALSKVEEGCYFCGKCEEVCPENIRILDLIIAAQGKRQADDKFVMRAGRGPASKDEIANSQISSAATGQIVGGFPGVFHILGCGDAKYQQDISWIAFEMLMHGAIVFTAGCGAAEIARFSWGKYIFEIFSSEYQPRCLINQGGCSACAHILDQALKRPRFKRDISHYANYAEIVADDYHNGFLGPMLIVWGALPERMQAIVAAWARAGMPVIIGPSSAFGWKRYLLGNKWEWERWWVYDTFDGGKKYFTEPGPKHLIIPVETKEEVVTAAYFLVRKAVEARESAQMGLDAYVDLYNREFGELPDDWQLVVRSEWEIPATRKIAMLKVLREKWGWDIERTRINKARHPDGRMLLLTEYTKQYGGAISANVTRLPRLLAQDVKTFRKKED